MTLDKIQRKVVMAGVLLFILMGLFPPWTYTIDARGINSEKPAGYSLLIEPPQPEKSAPMYGVKLDFSRLLIQWLVVAAATGFGVFAVKWLKDSEEKG